MQGYEGSVTCHPTAYVGNGTVIGRERICRELLKV
jgi:hypothetical protein